MEVCPLKNGIICNLIIVFVAFWACILFVAFCCFVISLCCFLIKCQEYFKNRKNHEYKKNIEQKNINKK